MVLFYPKGFVVDNRLFYWHAKYLPNIFTLTLTERSAAHVHESVA